MLSKIITDALSGAALGALGYGIIGTADLISGTPYNPEKLEETLHVCMLTGAAINLIAREILTPRLKRQINAMITSGLLFGTVNAISSAAARATGLFGKPLHPITAYGGAAIAFAVGALYPIVQPEEDAALDHDD